MRSIKMLLAMLAVGLLVCGSAAIVLAQAGIPGAGYSGPTPFGPGENWRPNNPAQKGWIHLAD